MRSPLPRIPLTGKCDAGGAATLTVTCPAGFWAAVYIALQVSAGSPSYTIQQGDALPLVFGGGQQTQLGPILMSPGESFQVLVKGAGALALVTGQVIGWQADNAEELPALLVSMGSVNIGSIAAGVTIPVSGSVNIGSISGGVTMPISGNVGITGSVTATITAGTVTIANANISVINAAGTQLLSASAQIDLGLNCSSGAAGIPATTTITLPPGTQALALFPAGGSVLAQYAHVLVKGHTFGVYYYDSYFFPSLPGAAGVAIMAVIPVLYATDPQLDITVAGIGVSVALRPVALLQSVPEFQEYYQPPWISPNRPSIVFATGAVAVAGDAVILPAIANIQYNLFNLEIYVVENVNLQQIYQDGYLFDSIVGNTVALWWNLALVPPTAPTNMIEYFDFRGMPLTRGAGLSYHNNNGTKTTMAIGTISFSKS